MALQLLDGLYEHSPWLAEKALDARPFHLRRATQVIARTLKDLLA